MSQSDDWLTTGEVSERIGRSSRAVRDLLDSDRFDYFPNAYRIPGGQWRVPLLDVEEFLGRMREASKRVRRGRVSEENAEED